MCLKWMMLHLNGGKIANAQEETVAALNDLSVIDPVKVGHSFVCWSNATESSEDSQFGYSDDTDLYALWEINNYTVTFDLGNGTLVSVSFPFNTTIVYPSMRGVKGFHGWNSSLERMPARDLVIGPAPSPKKSIRAGAIAGGVVGSVALIVIIVLFALFFALYNKWDLKSKSIGDLELQDAYPRIEERISGNDFCATISSKIEDNPAKYVGLYSEDYREQPIHKILTQTGLDKGRAEKIMNECKAASRRAELEGKAPSRLTKKDMESIAFYTLYLESRDFEYSPYRLLNKALASDNAEDLQEARDLLFNVMTALRKLPRHEGDLLYRGIRGSVDKSVYKPGAVVMWHGLLSVSTNINAVKSLLASSGELDVSHGTLFIIEGGWGYNVQQYSLYPEEEEILIEPERQFTVNSVIKSDMTIVSLQMLDTPLILPRVFAGDI